MVIGFCGLERRLVGRVAAESVGWIRGPRVLGRPGAAAAVPATATALAGEVAAGPVGLDHLGGGVAERRADLVDLDLVDGALLALPGLIGPLAQPPADDDAHPSLQALGD